MSALFGNFERFLPAGLDRDRCSAIWDDAEFRLTFALLFYRVALFHSRPAHVRIMNVLLRGMARALQIDIGASPLLFSLLYLQLRELPILSVFLPDPSLPRCSFLIQDLH